jgi:hypothetical protein
MSINRFRRNNIMAPKAAATTETAAESFAQLSFEEMKDIFEARKTEESAQLIEDIVAEIEDAKTIQKEKTDELLRDHGLKINATTYTRYMILRYAKQVKKPFTPSDVAKYLKDSFQDEDDLAAIKKANKGLYVGILYTDNPTPTIAINLSKMVEKEGLLTKPEEGKYQIA